MVTVKDYIKKCKFVVSNALDEQARIVRANEAKIIRLNVDAFQNGQGSDGKILINSNPAFKGTYTLFTNLLNPSKGIGDLYNFNESGAFLLGMQLEVRPDLTKFDLFSTGTGAGEKSIFFAGYTNLFGLDGLDTDIVNYDIIYPQLMLFIKKYL
jgi:hypothetical protein